MRQALSSWWGAQRRGRRAIGHGVMCAAALVMAFTPLFNLLGFEFAMAMGVLLALVAGPVGFGSLDAGSADLLDGLDPFDADAFDDLDDLDALDARMGPAETFGRLLLENLGLLLGPLLIITLNALRVRVCDYSGGLLMYGLLPGITALYVTLAAMASWGLAGGRGWWRGAVYYGMLLISVGGGAAYLALEPPIVMVNPYVGYFAGSIYDEALSVPWPLLAYRGVQVLLVLALVSGLEVAHRRQTTGEVPRRWWASLVVAGTLALTAHVYHVDLGYSLTRVDIQEALGGRHETEHFVIYFPASGDWARRIEEVGEDHEFRYAQLKALFELEPEGKLVSYIYPDRETKGRLMGARRTLVAKLWLGEMHIMYETYGSSVVKHELAHLFTAPFGSGPLSLSTKAWLFPNMGLVEGVASAAQWEGKGLTPHGWSAALRRLGKAPDVAAILGAAGFWTQHNRTVYTLMGSFSRWLIETRGIEKYRVAYAHGDFEGAYQEPLSELVAGWHAYLDEIELTEEDLELAKFKFDRPSIFGKVCARTLAEQRRQAARLEVSGRGEEALALMEDVCAQDPDNLGDRHALLQGLVRARQLERAREVAQEMLSREGIGGVMRAQVREALGDVQWMRGEVGEATATYRLILETPGLMPALRRSADLKLRGLEGREDVREELRAYFLAEGVGHVEKVARLYRARRTLSDSAELAYLLGLQLSLGRAHEESARVLGEALSLGLEGELGQKARWTRGKALFFSGELGEARVLFEELSEKGLREGDRAQARDWVERVDWKARRVSGARERR